MYISELYIDRLLKQKNWSSRIRGLHHRNARKFFPNDHQTDLLLPFLEIFSTIPVITTDTLSAKESLDPQNLCEAVETVGSTPFSGKLLVVSRGETGFRHQFSPTQVRLSIIYPLRSSSSWLHIASSVC